MDGPEYSPGLRSELPAAEDGRLLDPLELLVASKLLNNVVAQGRARSGRSRFQGQACIPKTLSQERINDLLMRLDNEAEQIGR
jgi:hypothetical protein